MNTQDWIKNNCKFAALSPADQARSEVVGISKAAVNHYKKYKANPSNAELATLFQVLDMLSVAVAQVETESQKATMPSEPTNVSQPMAQK